MSKHPGEVASGSMVEEKDEKDEKSGIKVVQVAAAALAAVTAALLGSTLGVAGTVLGAGMASIVTTVGSELYLRSLKRTREAAQRTKEVALAIADPRVKQTRAMPIARQVPGQHTAAYRQQTRTQRTYAYDRAGGQGTEGVPGDTVPGGSAPASDGDLTQRMPIAGHGQSAAGERTVFIPRPGSEVDPGPAEDGMESPETEPGKLRKLRWPLIIGTSVGAFVIGMLALTGIETATGGAVSGGNGTTFSQVVGGGNGNGGQPQEQPEQPQAPAPQDGEATSTTKAPGTSEQNEGDEPTEESSAPSSSEKPTSQPPSSSVKPTQQTPQPTAGGGRGPAGQERPEG
nr:hypothetical protein [Amycolatopsis antarctica]